MKLTFDYAMQILSILGNLFVVFLLWEMWVHKKFSVWYVFVRALFYRDIGPLMWLSSNVFYVGVAMVFIGHMFSLIGNIQQLRTYEIHTKLWVWFVSSPLNNFGLGLMILSPVLNFIKLRLSGSKT